MKTIYVLLSGGIGNQMFQYSAGRGVADKLGAELILDNWSGFVRDREYRRNYELGSFPIKARKATVKERWPIWLLRASQKFCKHPVSESKYDLIKLRRWYGTFVIDDNRVFYPKVFEPNDNKTWMIGCFQSPKYFFFISEKIRKELSPPMPTDPRVQALGERLRSQPTVAVGIRLYEEAKDPAVHALGRREKKMAEIREALERLSQRHPNLKVALFCTNRARALEELGLPHDTAYVTPEEGFHDAIASLWLLAQCRHHLFNNSSFYWWGAWLSGINLTGLKEDRQILASNNFFNKDTIPNNWSTF